MVVADEVRLVVFEFGIDGVDEMCKCEDGKMERGRIEKRGGAGMRLWISLGLKSPTGWENMQSYLFKFSVLLRQSYLKPPNAKYVDLTEAFIPLLFRRVRDDLERLELARNRHPMKPTPES